MKVSPKDINYIKTKIPLINKLINQNYIEKELINYNIKEYAITLWQNWLSREEYDEFFDVKSDQELFERRNRFNHLFDSLSKSSEYIFSFGFNKWKNKYVIKNISKQQKEKISCVMNQYSDNDDSIVRLILPKYQATIEMGCDWTGILYIQENECAEELFNHIKNAGLYFFEFK